MCSCYNRNIKYNSCQSEYSVLQQYYWNSYWTLHSISRAVDKGGKRSASWITCETSIFYWTIHKWQKAVLAVNWATTVTNNKCLKKQKKMLCKTLKQNHPLKNKLILHFAEVFTYFGWASILPIEYIIM